MTKALLVQGSNRPTLRNDLQEKFGQEFRKIKRSPFLFPVKIMPLLKKHRTLHLAVPRLLRAREHEQRRFARTGQIPLRSVPLFLIRWLGLSRPWMRNPACLSDGSALSCDDVTKFAGARPLKFIS